MDEYTFEAESEQDFESEVQCLFDEVGGVRYVSTFSDTGMMTRNSGLVIKLDNGAEFQVTIVQSQEAKDRV